jgi:PKD repeat protein
VSQTSPNYCISGPGATINWIYSDPQGSPQGAYQVQVTNNGSFNSPSYDSGQINSSAQSFALPTSTLQFNNTYQARVRVWNSMGGVSGWSGSTGSWTTPPYAYPQTVFAWSPNRPGQNATVQFTDQTTFGGGNPLGRSWSWTFGDGGTATIQNPTHKFTNIAAYTVTETATDAANQSCSATRTINVQKPVPVIKEVAPK